MSVVRPVVVLVLAAITCLLIVMFSVRADYYQGVRTFESHRYGIAISTSLSVFYGDHQRYSDELSKLAGPAQNPDYVGEVDYEIQTGVLTIRIAGESEDEGLLLFDPVRHGDLVAYSCHALNVPDKHIPANCLRY